MQRSEKTLSLTPGRGRSDILPFEAGMQKLSFRTPEGVTRASACITEADIRGWFRTVLEEITLENGLGELEDAHRIWNADESAFQLCPKSGKVLTTRGARNGNVVSMGNEESLTVFFNFSSGFHGQCPVENGKRCFGRKRD